jgi:hypothetical protein
MKSSIIAMSVAALLAFGAASAATPATATAAKPAAVAKAPVSANKGKKGADYKSDVSSCLKGGTAPAAAAPAAPMTQQDRMKSCNADAGKQALKGDARKTFMSGCLKKK